MTSQSVMGGSGRNRTQTVESKESDEEREIMNIKPHFLENWL